MNVKSILIWAMAIGTLSSCMSNEDMYDPEKAEALKVAKYEAAFVKKYGKVDPKQDWGFGEAEINGTSVTTRLGNYDGHLWWQYFDYNDIPAAVEQPEIDKVVEYFKNLPKDVKSVPINWSDYFIQQVYKGEQAYTARNGDSLLGSNMMNNLCDGTGKKIGDFNRGTSGQSANVGRYQNDNDSPRKGEMICLVQGGNTSDFGYQNSMVGDIVYNNKNFDNRVSIIQEIDGAYYVGLQFFAEGKYSNQQVEGNGKYTDWIVKITPAKYKNARRIMAEDLAVDNKSDFDFNDVVFDAVIINGEAVITLQAVGGTLPLCVGDESHEVHDLFGVGPTEFVNTQSREEKAPVMFRIPNVNSSLRDIRIIVDGADISNIQTGNKNMNVPAKLCCPTNYKWADEKNSIDIFFPKFEEAVGNSDVLWYEDGVKEWQ